jgi:chemotaxis protein histidine kinase CheA
MSAREAARFDPVKAAEAALARLADDFDDWMASEALTLSNAWTDIQTNGIDAERRDTLFRAAHDIKGQASTLGYPLVGAVAGNLCYLMDHVDTKLLPLTLIAQHVDAVRAMVAETAGEQENHTARALVDGLADVTEDFVARNGRPEQDD